MPQLVLDAIQLPNLGNEANVIAVLQQQQPCGLSKQCCSEVIKNAPPGSFSQKKGNLRRFFAYC